MYLDIIYFFLKIILNVNIALIIKSCLKYINDKLKVIGVKISFTLNKKYLTRRI